jgi:hypothetical protein
MLYKDHDRSVTEDAENVNYIFLLRGQKYINCHDELFLFSGLSTENKINPPSANSASRR